MMDSNQEVCKSSFVLQSIGLIQTSRLYIFQTIVVYSKGYYIRPHYWSIIGEKRHYHYSQTYSRSNMSKTFPIYNCNIDVFAHHERYTVLILKPDFHIRTCKQNVY